MLMLFMGMTPVYSGSDNKHIINFGKTGNVFNAKAGFATYNDIIPTGKYGFYCVLMVYTCLLAYEWEESFCKYYTHLFSLSRK
jgi:hypothetical protein